MTHFWIPAECSHRRREREKAKKLKNSGWWKQKISVGLCFHCQKYFTRHELTMDHLHPIVRGGKSTRKNCVVSCLACNQKRKAQMPVEESLERIKAHSV